MKTWLFLVTLVVFSQNLRAQCFQIQFQFGGNFSKSYLQANGQTVRETSTFFDNPSNVQYGAAFQAQIYRKFYLRLDGNYRSYRTVFHTEYPPSYSFTTGNLLNQKINLALLPEFRGRWIQNDHTQVFGYVFAGPVWSLESGKNYSESDIFNQGVETVINAIKPDPETGWTLGGGINPQFRHIGLLLEARYSRFGYANEGITVGKIAYGHFTTMLGITVQFGE